MIYGFVTFKLLIWSTGWSEISQIWQSRAERFVNQVGVQGGRCTPGWESVPSQSWWERCSSVLHHYGKHGKHIFSSFSSFYSELKMWLLRENRFTKLKSRNSSRINGFRSTQRIFSWNSFELILSSALYWRVVLMEFSAQNSKFPMFTEFISSKWTIQESASLS